MIRVILLFLLSIVLAPAADVTGYFLKVPHQPFLEGTQRQLLEIAGRGHDGVIDKPNGYVFVPGDGAQVSLQIVLFRYHDRSPLLVVAWGNLEEEDFTHLTLFREEEGKMVVADRAIFPVADSDDHRFELPRFGRTVIVRKRGGGVEKWTWDGGEFVKG